LLIYFVPPLDDFEPKNPYWNGLSDMHTLLDINIISDVKELSRIDNPESHVLLVIGPSNPYSLDEVNTIRDFINKGGMLILADEFGSGNELLKGLGVNVRLNGSLLIDPLFKERSSRIPKITDFDKKILSYNITQIFLNYATVIQGSNLKPLASSSSFSYLDLNHNFKYDKGEPKGPFFVMAEINYGKGSIVIISDSSIFINSMLSKGDNLALIKGLKGSRKLILDTSHFSIGLFTKLKVTLMLVFGIISVPEARYTIALIAVALVLKVKFKAIKPKVDKVEELIRKYPNWNKELLKKLEGELQSE